ncbi:MAG: hypothetical protein J4473_03115 [Candidatus Aenigmarchaeota archaeon]|nr:hypothetical protein [Candidatus Aenigmarchaeota archaeon]
MVNNIIRKTEELPTDESQCKIIECEQENIIQINFEEKIGTIEASLNSLSEKIDDLKNIRLSNTDLISIVDMQSNLEDKINNIKTMIEEKDTNGIVKIYANIKSDISLLKEQSNELQNLISNAATIDDVSSIFSRIVEELAEMRKHGYHENISAMSDVVESLKQKFTEQMNITDSSMESFKQEIINQMSKPVMIAGADGKPSNEVYNKILNSVKNLENNIKKDVVETVSRIEVPGISSSELKSISSNVNKNTEKITEKLDNIFTSEFYEKRNDTDSALLQELKILNAHFENLQNIGALGKISDMRSMPGDKKMPKWISNSRQEVNTALNLAEAVLIDIMIAHALKRKPLRLNEIETIIPISKNKISDRLKLLLSEKRIGKERDGRYTVYYLAEE